MNTSVTQTPRTARKRGVSVRRWLRGHPGLRPWHGGRGAGLRLPGDHPRWVHGRTAAGARAFTLLIVIKLNSPDKISVYHAGSQLLSLRYYGILIPWGLIYYGPRASMGRTSVHIA